MTETATYGDEDKNNEIIVPETTNMQLAGDPGAVLFGAHKAAKALADVVSKKTKPVIFNGQQYLEFEDWQTVGRFYGITAKITSAEYVEYGEAKGFVARAVAYQTSTGQEISAAEAMCLTDEANWSKKPMFQLKSMAQTRAAAKALRNVLAWVVVLAGYKPTLAEEVVPGNGGTEPTPEIKSPSRASHGLLPCNGRYITDKQRKRLYAIYKGSGKTDSEVKDYLLKTYGLDSSLKITEDIYESICKWAEVNSCAGA